MNEDNSEYQKVKDLLDCYDPYHIHKENMAYAGMLLLVGMFSWIMTTDKWPPCWANQHCCWVGQVVPILLVWAPIHLFVGWQLAKKRTAAKHINAAMKYLWGGTYTKILRKKKILRIMLMYFWPSTQIETDVMFENPDKLPKGFLEILEDIDTDHTEEWLLWSGSHIVLGLIIVRTIWP